MQVNVDLSVTPRVPVLALPPTIESAVDLGKQTPESDVLSIFAVGDSRVNWNVALSSESCEASSGYAQRGELEEDAKPDWLSIDLNETSGVRSVRPCWMAAPR